MVNIFHKKSSRASECARAKMEANKKNQQESPVNFIWGEPVHAKNLRGAQV